MPNSDAFEADANLLGSWAVCKTIGNRTGVAELCKLWRSTKDGEELDPGGLVHGDDSPHYRWTVGFVEGVFVTQAEQLLESTFSELAQAAAERPTADARIATYEQAADRFDQLFGDLDFERTDFDQRLADKRNLLEQLADAEREPERATHAKLFVYSMHRHLQKGSWTTPAESTLSEADADRIAKAVVADRRAAASLERYPAKGWIKFSKGCTIAYRAIAALLRG